MDLTGLELLRQINDKSGGTSLKQGRSFMGRILSGEPRTIIGKGIDLDDDSKDITLTVKDADRSGHFGCFGTTRIGKTRLLESIVEQDIRKGYNVVLIDPKGDVDLFSKIVQVAAEAGRLEDLMYLTPIYPQYSIMLNPLSHYYMEDELVDHVVSGIKAKEDYFIAIASEVTQAVISGQAKEAEFRNRPFETNFRKIKEKLDHASLKAFQGSLEQIQGNMPEVKDITADMQQILTSTPDFFSKVASSLRTALSALSSGNTGKIIGRANVNEFVERFEHRKGVILYCNTGSLLARRTAHIVGRVLVSMIQSMIGRFLASGRRLDPPLCLHIDEGHNILYLGIQELFSKGGGANCWVHLYTQSTALIEQEIGREATRSILDNINTWIFMLVNHPETAQYMEDSAKTVKKQQMIVNMGTGASMRELEEKQVLAEKVLRLPKRQFFMRSYGHFWKGETLDVPPPYVNLIFPRLTGSDPEQETEFHQTIGKSP